MQINMYKNLDTSAPQRTEGSHDRCSRTMPATHAGLRMVLKEEGCSPSLGLDRAVCWARDRFHAFSVL